MANLGAFNGSSISQRSEEDPAFGDHTAAPVHINGVDDEIVDVDTALASSPTPPLQTLASSTDKAGPLLEEGRSHVTSSDRINHRSSANGEVTTHPGLSESTSYAKLPQEKENEKEAATYHSSAWPRGTDFAAHGPVSLIASSPQSPLPVLPERLERAAVTRRRSFRDSRGSALQIGSLGSEVIATVGNGSVADEEAEELEAAEGDEGEEEEETDERPLHVSQSERRVTDETQSDDAPPPGGKKRTLSVAEERARAAQEEEEDRFLQNEWKHQSKHIFIFSDAGKPLYSRYGDESKLCPFFGLLLAMTSVVARYGDTIKTIIAGKHKMVFVRFGALHLVAVASTREPVSHLVRQLSCLHSQIVSTVPGIDKIFASRPHFDVRSFMTGTDRFFDNLIDRLDTGPAYMLGGIRCLRLPPGVRETIATVLRSVQAEDLVYAILLARDKLVHFVRPRNHPLHPTDLELVINFVKSSPSFIKNESWVPLCLPMFNDRGYLYAYVCYLIEDVCLLLLSTNQSKEKFFEFSKFKNSIYKALLSAQALKAIHKSMTIQDYSIYTISIKGLVHFMYKSIATSQITYLALKAPYNARKPDKERLFRLYQYAQDKINTEDAYWRASNNMNRVLYMCTEYETVLSWRTDEFELHAVFWAKPLITLPEMVRGSNAILAWIRKEESTLFIGSAYPTTWT